jgi:DNA-binding MarR family transcriptional regulator
MKNKTKTKTILSEQDEDLCVEIFGNIMRARHLLYDKAARIAAATGLHAAELNLVDILGKYGPMSMGRLSRETFISPANTTSTAKKLEQVDLVQRERSAESGREVTVSLTSKGRALFRRSYPRILEQAHEYIADRLTREERVTLAAVLRKLVA